jgi:hypothetical protein
MLIYYYLLIVGSLDYSYQTQIQVGQLVVILKIIIKVL